MSPSEIDALASEENGPSRLREAEAHLWALVVWFGGSYGHPYITRDVAAAAGYVERHLSGEDMTKRHREVVSNA